MTKALYVVNDQNRQHIAAQVKALPVGYMVRTGPKNRSLEQNAKLHAMFGELEKQAKYMGRTLTAHQWKSLMVSGHSLATGLGVEMIPGLEGEFLNIRESSASMTVGRMNSLIEYMQAWAAENNVRFSE